MANESNRTRKTSGRVTLADVAKKVGVGTMTVSRALRTPELVSAHIREKIQQVVEQLGYVPNFSARQLASAVSQNLVIITSSITSRENALILSALQHSIRDLGLQIVILIANDQHWLKTLINHAPQAIVLLNFDCPPHAAEWIKNSHIPTLEIGAMQKNPIDINVGIDSKLAMSEMIHFLLAQGYQEIGLLCANQEIAIFQQYMESWHTTLLAKHINPHLIYHCAEEISFSAGAKLLSEAMLIWGKIDAFVFLSDELACGALYEAHRRHIAIPNDIAIASLGGLEVGEVAHPKLTTISIPYEKMGNIAGQLLTKIIKGEHLSQEQKIVRCPITLVKRNSA